MMRGGNVRNSERSLDAHLYERDLTIGRIRARGRWRPRNLAGEKAFDITKETLCAFRFAVREFLPHATQNRTT
jgi:hypothetical protein